MKFFNSTTRIVILLAMFLSAIFYWFELRPAAIKKRCAKEAGAPKLVGLKQLDQLIFVVPKEMTEYEYCLRRNGL